MACVKIKLFIVSLHNQNGLGKETEYKNKTFEIQFVTSSMKLCASNITCYMANTQVMAWETPKPSTYAHNGKVPFR